MLFFYIFSVGMGNSPAELPIRLRPVRVPVVEAPRYRILELFPRERRSDVLRPGEPQVPDLSGQTRRVLTSAEDHLFGEQTETG